MSKEMIMSRDSRTSVGFWIYLMTDCMLFASLFATYAVLRNATAAGPSGQEIFSMPLVLAETIILLISSFAAGVALLAFRNKLMKLGVSMLAVTYVLGVAFLTIELTEFSALIAEGHSWQQSAFLSSFFVLVGTHGLHIAIGLLWLIALSVMLLRKGMTDKISRQLALFVVYWHFLDLIWIFIFSIVYLYGVSA